jgi:hypothetical protein
MDAQGTIRDFWQDKLITVSEEALQEFNLPSETVSMLTVVGLPMDDRLGRYSNLGIEFRPRDLHSFTFEGERYIAAGLFKSVDDYLGFPDIKLCLHERTGRVFAVEVEAEYPPTLQFMNTDLEKLLLFLKICLQHTPRMLELSNDIDDLVHRRVTKERLEESRRSLDPQKEYDQLLDIHRYEFLKVDPEALSDSKHYWHRVLFDWSI